MHVMPILPETDYAVFVQKLREDAKRPTWLVPTPKLEQAKALLKEKTVMRYLKKTQGVLVRRIAKIEALGFEMVHDEKGRVEVGDGEMLTVDFSAIDENKFLEHALKETFRQGKVQGRNEVRARFRELMEEE